MRIAIILAGGIGSRMGNLDRPKQYLEIEGRMVISHCLEAFEKNDKTDAICIVADQQWHDTINQCLKAYNISKFACYAEPGETRQLSIFNGLKAMKHKLKEQDIVIIHDAARPLVSQGMIDACYTNCDGFDGAMPVLPAKDTYYLSSDGTHITSLLKRNELFAGQAPESFVFGKYYEVHKNMSYEELKQINGSSEIAYLCGLQIKMFPGDEKNFKITTQADIENFKRIIQGV